MAKYILILGVKGQGETNFNCISLWRGRGFWKIILNKFTPLSSGDGLVISYILFIGMSWEGRGIL